jgi:hypothetical protein
MEAIGVRRTWTAMMSLSERRVVGNTVSKGGVERVDVEVEQRETEPEVEGLSAGLSHPSTPSLTTSIPANHSLHSTRLFASRPTLVPDKDEAKVRKDWIVQIQCGTYID